MIKRPICTICNKNFCAINCIKNDKKYYRKWCDICGRNLAKKPPRKPNWVKSGYKKKTTCDLCGFKSIYSSQITVFHIDGKLENVSPNNLRSICLNCVEIVKKKEVNWRRGDLQIEY